MRRVESAGWLIRVIRPDLHLLVWLSRSMTKHYEPLTMTQRRALSHDPRTHMSWARACAFLWAYDT
jgi:hypothetical protein